MKVKDSLGNSVFLESKILAQGGQAKIVRVQNKNDIAKIYHKLEKHKKLQIEEKLLFMIDNIPFDKNTPDEIVKSIVWPNTVLYDDTGFLGYSMTYIENSIELTNLTLPISGNNTNKIKNKFKRLNNNNFFIQRLTICYNIASVLQEFHRKNQYVVVDLKPQNILIDVNGQIAFIDVDSIQVSSDSKIYYADAWTDTCCPPEFFKKKINPKNQKILPSWDYFAFACTAYSILFELPAFSGTVANCTQITDNIANQYFPNGKNRKKFIVVPAPHKNFDKLTGEIKVLFRDTFDCHLSYRPNFDDWKVKLKRQIDIASIKPKPKPNPKNTKLIIGIIFILALITININFSYEIKVYDNIFNKNILFIVSEDDEYTVVETQKINGTRWERRVIETESGKIIGWVK